MYINVKKYLYKLRMYNTTLGTIHKWLHALEGGGGLTKAWCSKGGCVDLLLWLVQNAWQGGGGGLKSPKICVTSFMDGPLIGFLVPLRLESNLALLGNPLKMTHIMYSFFSPRFPLFRMNMRQSRMLHECHEKVWFPRCWTVGMNFRLFSRIV